MTKPPETIYLQCYDEAGELLDLVHDDVTWCVDQINERDAVYKLEPAPDALPCRTITQEHCQAGQCSHLRVLFGMGCSGPNRKDKRYACIHPQFDDDLRIIPPPRFGSAPWTPGWCPLIESDALPCGHPRDAVRGDGVTHWCAKCEEDAE